LGRHPSFHTANCPVHPAPPLLTGIYRTKPERRQRSWG
jgi:hypothetical protein